MKKKSQLSAINKHEKSRKAYEVATTDYRKKTPKFPKILKMNNQQSTKTSVSAGMGFNV